MQSTLLKSLHTVWRAFANTTQAFVLPDGFTSVRASADATDSSSASATAPGAGLSLPDGTDRTERRQCRPLPA
jgi:hypothetical protein